MPKYLLYCKTTDAFVFKSMCELLQNNIRKACFEISDTGIRLCTPDTYHHILVNLSLDAENFQVYKFTQNEKKYIGINTVHLHKCVKTIKKKDSLDLFIDEKEPNELGIRVFPKENNGRVTLSKVKIQNMQYIDTELPLGYGKPVIVPSSEYQKMTKEMNSIGSTIKISSKGFMIKFISDPSGTYSKVVTFGDNVSDEDTDSEEEEYTQDFETEKLNRITKIAGLSSNMQIYLKEDLPLLFKSSVGNLGKISIYIKSKEQINSDNTVMNENESDEDMQTMVQEVTRGRKKKQR